MENNGIEEARFFLEQFFNEDNGDWFEEFGGTNGLRSSDLLSLWSNEGITELDLLPYTFPSREEFKKKEILGIFLGHYIPWDGHLNAEFSKKNGSMLS